MAYRSQQLDVTSVDPLNLALRAKSTTVRVWWWSITIIDVVLLIYGMTILIAKFQGNQTNAVVNLRRSQAPFPAVTFCNMNPYKKSALATLPELANLIDQYNNASKSSADTTSKADANTIKEKTGLSGKRRKRAVTCCGPDNYDSTALAATSGNTYARCENPGTWKEAWSCCLNNKPPGVPNRHRLARIDSQALVNDIYPQGIVGGDEAWCGMYTPYESANPVNYFWYDTPTTYSGPKIILSDLDSNWKSADGTWSGGGVVVVYTEGRNVIFNNFGEDQTRAYICEYYNATSSTTVSTSSSTKPTITTKPTSASSTSTLTIPSSSATSRPPTKLTPASTSTPEISSPPSTVASSSKSLTTITAKSASATATASATSAAASALTSVPTQSDPNTSTLTATPSLPVSTKPSTSVPAPTPNLSPSPTVSSVSPAPSPIPTQAASAITVSTPSASATATATATTAATATATKTEITSPLMSSISINGPQSGSTNLSPTTLTLSTKDKVTMSTIPTASLSSAISTAPESAQSSTTKAFASTVPNTAETAANSASVPNNDGASLAPTATAASSLLSTAFTATSALPVNSITTIKFAIALSAASPGTATIAVTSATSNAIKEITSSKEQLLDLTTPSAAPSAASPAAALVSLSATESQSVSGFASNANASFSSNSQSTLAGLESTVQLASSSGVSGSASTLLPLNTDKTTLSAIVQPELVTAKPSTAFSQDTGSSQPQPQSTAFPLGASPSELTMVTTEIKTLSPISPTVVTSATVTLQSPQTPIKTASQVQSEQSTQKPSGTIANSDPNLFVEAHGNAVAENAVLIDAIPYVLASLSPDVLEKAGYNVTEVIMRCVYNGARCGFSDFKLKQDTSFGNCYTFNADGKRRLALQAGASTGLSVTYNVGQSEFLDYSQAAGVRVVVHEQDETVFPDVMGINVPGGYQSSAAMRRVEIKTTSLLLDCAGSPLDVSTYNYNESIYATEACIRSCYQNQVIKKCQCGDPRVPLPSHTQVGHCDLRNRTCVNDNFNVEKGSCNCPRACHVVDHEITQTMSSWAPFYVANTQFINIDGTANLSSKTLGKDVARIDIYYEDLLVLEYVEGRQYTLEELLWDLSSIIGLTLGISVISVFEVIKLEAWCRKKCNG